MFSLALRVQKKSLFISILVHQMFREALAQIDTSDEGGNKEDTVIISKPIHTMGPPFPLTLVRQSAAIS